MSKIRCIVFLLLASSQLYASDPAVNFQLAPVDKLLADAQALSRLSVDADGQATFDEAIHALLGDKKFTGLDTSKPIVGYLEIDTKTREFKLFVALPISTLKEFDELLTRVEIDKESIEKEPGLYELDMPASMQIFPKNPLMRIVGNSAYIGWQAEPKDMTETKLTPVGKLFLPPDDSAIRVQIHPQRLPKEFFAQMEKELGMEPDVELPGSLSINFKAVQKFLKGLHQDYLRQTEKLEVKLGLDFDMSQAKARILVDPVAGGTLAKSIVARPANSNSFGSVANEDSVVGVVYSQQRLQKESQAGRQELLLSILESTAFRFKELHPDLPKEVQRGFRETLDAGKFDLALALKPNAKSDHFGVQMGLSYGQPAKLEKLLRQAVSELPEPLRKAVKWDVAKAGETSIHTHDLLASINFPGDEYLFGQKPTCAFAFGSAGLYIAYGEEAVSQLQAIVNSPAKPAKVFDLQLQGQALSKIFDAFGGGDTIAKSFRNDDKLRSHFSFDVTGGKQLQIDIITSLRHPTLAK
jgi:hypothetical protein